MPVAGEWSGARRRTRRRQHWLGWGRKALVRCAHAIREWWFGLRPEVAWAAVAISAALAYFVLRGFHDSAGHSAEAALGVFGTGFIGIAFSPAVLPLADFLSQFEPSSVGFVIGGAFFFCEEVFWPAAGLWGRLGHAGVMLVTVYGPRQLAVWSRPIAVRAVRMDLERADPRDFFLGGFAATPDRLEDLIRRRYGRRWYRRRDARWVGHLAGKIRDRVISHHAHSAD